MGQSLPPGAGAGFGEPLSGAGVGSVGTGVVSAGGLGLVFFRQMAMFNYGGVATVILAVLLLIIVGEIVSYYARKAII